MYVKGFGWGSQVSPLGIHSDKTVMLFVIYVCKVMCSEVQVELSISYSCSLITFQSSVWYWKDSYIFHVHTSVFGYPN